MTRATNGSSELVDAALAIEEQLTGLEEMSVSLKKITLGTEKSIKRAARELGTATELQEKLAESLRALALVLVGLQQRQNGAIERLAAYAESLRDRHNRMGELMQRYATLGTKAAAIADGIDPSSDGAALSAVRTKLNELVDEAKRVGDDADREEFGEIAREANALKQKLQATLARLEKAKPS